MHKLLLEPAEFQEHRDELEPLLVVDLCSADSYRAGHVPGAVHLPPAALQSGQPPVPGRIPDRDRLAELFSYLGLSPETRVVAYDDEGGGWAGRLLWTLEAIGHPQYSYLNGGIHAWRAEGLPEETEPVRPTPTTVSIELRHEPIAEVEDILPRLGDSDFAIWDARSQEEYLGLRSGSARAGHIPGAINIDWLELIDRNNAMRLVDLEPLRTRLKEVGLDPEKDIVTHCQSHHRSSLTWLVMKILGYPSVKGYHGSWGEWGNRKDLPVEQ